MDKAILESHFEPFVRHYQPPALVAGLIVDSKLEQIFSYTKENNSNPPEKWKFRIASMTKCFTAAATLLLRDRKKLSLSNRVIDYVPQLRTVENFSEITIYQLLTMQTGLPNDDPWADRFLGCSEEDFDEILGKGFSFAAKPGQEYHYSNLGYMILGRVLSAAAGESILTFIENNFIKPLGMSNTAWNASDELKQAGYCYREDQLVAETDFQVQSVSDVFAGLWSTIGDLAIWVNFLLDADKIMKESYEHILSSSSRRELHSPVILAPSRDSSLITYEHVFYGFGIRQFVKDDHCFFGHTGGLPGFGSHFRWSRQKQFAVIACANLTYCPVWTPCRELMATLEKKAFNKESSYLDIVLERGEQLVKLILNWNEDVLSDIFSYNLFLDSPKSEIIKQFSTINKKYPDFKDNYFFATERGLGAKLLIEKKPLLLYTLSPARDAKIQEIKFLS